jgi:hypothetical protein
MKLVNEKVSEVTPEMRKSLKNQGAFNIIKQKLKNKIIPEFKDKLDNFRD